MRKQIPGKKCFEDMLGQYFVVQQERIPGQGEDSFYMEVGRDIGLAGVFDGSGGAGARKYPAFDNHSGAYIAARILTKSVLEWSEETKGCGDADSLKRKIDGNLARCGRIGGKSRMKGSLMKEFPSTLAMTRVYMYEQKLRADFFWSGDSRGYILDVRGLHQMTEDDVEDSDALRNLSADAVMNNLISASHKYVIRKRSYQCPVPCIVFTATDGCFTYLKSPMEFERQLLMTMQQSKSCAEWQERLNQCFDQFAGDDYTMCALILGFGSFRKMKKHFARRLDTLQNNCPDTEDRDLVASQWKIYKRDYEGYHDGVDAG